MNDIVYTVFVSEGDYSPSSRYLLTRVAVFYFYTTSPSIPNNDDVLRVMYTTKQFWLQTQAFEQCISFVRETEEVRYGVIRVRG